MSGPQRILLVEDRESLRKMLNRALQQEGYVVVSVASGEDAVKELSGSAFDLVLTDLKLPGLSGLEVVDAARRLQSSVPVAVMTAYGTVATAVDAMKRGAVDFLEKPVELDDLYRLAATWTRGESGGHVFAPAGAPPIVGAHPRLRSALRLLQRVAPTESTVLLSGESGTGKELFARAIHALSPRAGGPFMALNCAAIPESLLENELFGHEKGAYTGAHEKRRGRFREAQGGTLFLDEVGELGLSVQAKLLRVLEEKTFEPVGGGAPVQADVRLVAATNRKLERMVEEGSFRSDLFFRLETFPIHLPSLREIQSDVALIAPFLVAQAAERLQRQAPELSDSAREWLAQQDWPGNVRQLSNLLERALILSDRSCLTAADLEALDSRSEIGSERQALKDALEEARGDARAAAEILGVSCRTLRRRIARHGLEGFPLYCEGD
jgi:DNA-binding NtrC family response regulator